MPEESIAGSERGFETLRQFARARRKPDKALEHCEMCSAGLAQEHPHLIELSSRQIICACDACALLFEGMEKSKYKRVARRAEWLTNFEMTDGQWESLLIPINMALFFYSSSEGKMMALYPSPAGAVESLLSLDAWNEIEEVNPVLRRLRPDIEALLVNRVGHAHGMSKAEYFIAPMDECYRLVGLIRSHWRGLSGGSEVWQEVGKFFSNLRAKADPVSGAPNA